MGNMLARKRNVGFALREEAVEGTLIAEEAASACAIRVDGFESPTLTPALLDEGYITASLSKTAPVVGRYEDVGYTLPVFARGKGTLTYPDWHVAMKSVMGLATTEDSDVVGATPNTSIFTVASGAKFTEGQLILVNVTGYGLALSRVVDIATNQLTIWPPLPVTPTAGDVVYAGQNWMLSSLAWPTFSSYFHFDGPKQVQLAGCRSTALKMTFEVGQRVTMDFTVKALTPVRNNTARGVTPTLDLTTKPPTCLGMTIDMTYSAVAKGTPTVTQTVLTAPPFGVATSGDYLLADVGTLAVGVAVTFTNATDILNAVAHGLVNGDRVKLVNSGGALPAGLSSAVRYFVVNKHDNNFQIALTLGGAAVLFTDDGTGTHTLQKWTKNSGNYQTVAITNAVGDSGTDTTLTHATLTSPVDTGDTVYIARKKCAGVGDMLEINVELTQEMLGCMQAANGYSGSEITDRNVTVTKSPWFDSWQEFDMMDGLVSAELRLVLGSTLGNIFTVMLPNLINREVALTSDDLIKVDATAQAVTDTRFLGNNHEIVIATF